MIFKRLLRLLAYLLAGLILAGVGGALWVTYQTQDLEVERLTPDLHVIYGLGGNVAVLRTSAGAVIIDTMTFQFQGGLIRDLAEQLTGQPVTHIINTHYHLDHTHGNPAFAAGTEVVSTVRTLHHLQQLDAEYFSGAAAELLPNSTFEESMELKVGNKTLLLLHPGRGHTDGDLVALMVEDQAVHLGDLFFHRHYPNIDLEAGGSVQEWGETLGAVLALEFRHAIPGHGLVTGRAGLLQFQTFIRQLADIGRWAREEGISLQETRMTTRLTEDAGYEPIRFIVPLGLDRAFVLTRAWEETHGAFKLHEPDAPAAP